ncbi:MerR family transcriptional regulator [Paenibacillus popilliae]|uniref:MerR family transcriptional regulator n=1 Tax=Paenibacillus popilliae TaxID=78057 RepID=A0ABY3AKV9_PAEPP|nr:helix-turn-helix domain-containing protein [Paenibacillus sp. SDF0028]TQR42866.1 MerR family transcriptional regulator [Paenibacillus sp. SDF0028]
MTKLSIGRMAELNHTSVQTLRYYDKLGLLKPEFIEESTGYRYYAIKQCARLDMINYMKYLGMSLDSIKAWLDHEEVESIPAMLRKQAALIEQKMNELEQMRRAVNVSINNYETYIQAPKDGYIVLEHIPARKVFCYDSGINIYENTLESYEYILRELRTQAIVNHLPMAYFCNVGSMIRKDRLKRGEFVSTEIFLFVDDDFAMQEGVEWIPEHDYLCIYCSSFFDEQECANKLLAYVRELDYDIIGDYICEVVVELPVFHHEERNMFMKLQIPVQKGLTL